MNYAAIDLCDVINGKGVRVSLFVSGCTFHCKGCFNQEAQDFSYGKLFTDKVEKLILDQLKDPKYSGLSILGGDPLCQNEEGLKQLSILCSKVHSLGKDVWLWSGYRYQDILEDTSSLGFLRKVLLDNVDVFIDGTFHEDEKDLGLAFRGSSNQHIISLKKDESFEKTLEY